MRYDFLQPLSLVLESFADHRLARYWTCEFPATWAQPLREKVFRPATAEGESEEEKRGIPLWAVNGAIAALMPQVLTHDARARRGEMWLAWAAGADEKAPDRALLVEFVKGGLVAAATHRNQLAQRRGRPPVIDLTALAAVLETFRGEDLTFTRKTLDLGPGADPESSDYTLVPHALATHLCLTDWHVVHGGTASEPAAEGKEDGEAPEDEDGEAAGKSEEEGVTARVVHTTRWRRTAARDGAELVSWPPYVYESKGGVRYPWSYTLRLSVQTRGLEATVQPRLHVRVGMRRWARYNVFDAKRNIGVHLFSPSPWADASSPFGLASMAWHRGPAGKKQGFMGWADDLVPTLERLGSFGFLPDPAELAGDPLAFLEPGTDGEGHPREPIAGVPYRPGLGKNTGHAVGDGVSAKDKWRIFSQLVPALKGFAALDEPHVRVPVPTRVRPTAEELLRIDRSALATAAGPRIEIVLWCDTTTMRDEALNAVALALDLPLDAADQPEQVQAWRKTFALPELEVLLRVEPVGAIADDLDLDEKIRRRSDRLKDAGVSRQVQVRKHLGQPEPGVTSRFVLVEMRGADGFTSLDHDPKMTVRAGAATCGAVTQNLLPPAATAPDGDAEDEDGAEEESVKSQRERTRRAVGDLLIRQSGLIRPPARQGTTEHPLTDVACLGLWVVRRTGDFRTVMPLAVASVPDRPNVLVRLPHSGWLTYHQASVQLAGWNRPRTFDKPEIQDFFADCVADSCDGGDLALFTLAQNLRAECPALTNPKLVADRLAFHADRPLDADRYKGLRHIRLRTNVRDESAQHFAYGKAGPQGRVGVGGGLWASTDNDRLFFATADKPKTAGPGSPGGSRLEPHRGKNRARETVWKVDVCKDVWNPQLLELLVAVKQNDDSAAAWAALAHQRRSAAAHFADPVTLPIELHLAYKLGSALLPSHQLETIEQPESS
ncbi:RNaseH domain-containing protein [Streptomyces sp. MNU76]|uniref:RNaseH domain-containing protein n=1 Tax=Streptomyces sp. MNU76 TaxID=2560026 RepID=UPI001E367F48|nr:RNaseH domain-containing protein [Streptomyces sp. MNU76]MCC9711806.1 RNaseH domain-containing protein [Streptomyces sp. MNU76]